MDVDRCHELFVVGVDVQEVFGYVAYRTAHLLKVFDVQFLLGFYLCQEVFCGVDLLRILSSRLCTLWVPVGLVVGGCGSKRCTMGVPPTWLFVGSYRE